MDFEGLLVTIIAIASSFFKGNFFFIFPEIIYLLLAVLGLRCCAGFSLAVGSGACSLVAVRWLLAEVASLVAEHGF